MARRKRADVLLVERGLFESRTRAQAAIAAGLVTADGVPLRKASDELAADAALEMVIVLRAITSLNWDGGDTIPF